MKALVNFQPLSFNTSGEYFLIWKQISTSPEGLRSREVAKPPHPLPQLSHPSIPRILLVSTVYSRYSGSGREGWTPTDQEDTAMKLAWALAWRNVTNMGLPAQHKRPPCQTLDASPSPLVSVQSTAVSMAFSRGSPTRVPSSSCMSEWQEARARCVSMGMLDTGVTSFPSLQRRGQLVTR